MNPETDWGNVKSAVDIWLNPTSKTGSLTKKEVWSSKESRCPCLHSFTVNKSTACFLINKNATQRFYSVAAFSFSLGLLLVPQVLAQLLCWKYIKSIALKRVGFPMSS